MASCITLLVSPQISTLSFELMSTGTQKFENQRSTGRTRRLTWRGDNYKKAGQAWGCSAWTERLTTHIWFYLSLHNPDLRKYFKLKEPFFFCDTEGEMQWKPLDTLSLLTFCLSFFKDLALLFSDVIVLWRPHICESGSRCHKKDLKIFKSSMILGKGGSQMRK